METRSSSSRTQGCRVTILHKEGASQRTRSNAGMRGANWERGRWLSLSRDEQAQKDLVSGDHERVVM
jgi:hypothetical protein